jgi:predicted MFS family arabinose efflux permease
MQPANSSNRTLWFSVLILFAINILNFYDRHVPGALVEPMRKEFHLTDTQVGLLSSGFTWIYAIVGLPLGILADRGNRKSLLAWGVVVWAALTASSGLVTSFVMLFLSRAGVGIGEAACAPTATSWLGDLFPPQKRSRVLALFMLGVPVGGALGYFFGGPIAQAYGWRTSMVLAAVPALILVPALLLLREPQRGASESSVLSASVPRHSVWGLLRIPTFLWIIASGALLNFNAYAFATFLPAFLSRVHGLSLANSGRATGVAYFCGGLLGCLTAGYLGDTIARRRKDGRLLYAAAISLVGVPLGCVAFLQRMGSLYVALLFLALTYAALSSYYGLVYSAMHDVVSPNQRASAMAVYFLAMYLCGASYGPLLVGKVSDLLARRASALAGSSTVSDTFRAVGLQQALLTIPAVSALLALVLYMGSRTIKSDVERREAVGQGALAASD